MKKSISFPFHPLLFALFPIITLIAQSQTLSLKEVLISAGIIVSFAALLSFTRYVNRDWHKRAALVSLFLVVFFAYGYPSKFVSNISLPFSDIERSYLTQAFLLIGSAAAIILGSWLIIKTGRPLKQITIALNIAALCTLSIGGAQIAVKQIITTATKYDA